MTDVLLINGTVGVGKSTVADRVGALLEARGVPGAVLDLDALRWAWPAPPDDRFNAAVALANLASVAANYRAAGFDTLVLAGVIENGGERSAHEHAVGGAVFMVRLVGPGEVVDDRIAARQADDPEGRDWHLRRRPELEGIQAAADADDVVIEIGARAPDEVAADILRLWLPAAD